MTYGTGDVEDAEYVEQATLHGKAPNVPKVVWRKGRQSAQRTLLMTDKRRALMQWLRDLTAQNGVALFSVHAASAAAEYSLKDPKYVAVRTSLGVLHDMKDIVLGDWFCGETNCLAVWVPPGNRRGNNGKQMA